MHKPGSAQAKGCPTCRSQPRKTKKMAWACSHADKPHYGKGLCGNCYHLAYYHKRRALLTAAEPKQQVVTIQAGSALAFGNEPQEHHDHNSTTHSNK